MKLVKSIPELTAALEAHTAAMLAPIGGAPTPDDEDTPITDLPDQNEPKDEPTPSSDVSAKDVKKLAKELVEKQISTRDKVKKLIVGTGNQKISQMDQAARNTVYHSLMNAFTLADKKQKK